MTVPAKSNFLTRSWASVRFRIASLGLFGLLLLFVAFGERFINLWASLDQLSDGGREYSESHFDVPDEYMPAQVIEVGSGSVPTRETELYKPQPIGVAGVTVEEEQRTLENIQRRIESQELGE